MEVQFTHYIKLERTSSRKKIFKVHEQKNILEAILLLDGEVSTRFKLKRNFYPKKDLPIKSRERSDLTGKLTIDKKTKPSFSIKNYTLIKKVGNKTLHIGKIYITNKQIVKRFNTEGKKGILIGHKYKISKRSEFITGYGFLNSGGKLILTTNKGFKFVNIYLSNTIVNHTLLIDMYELGELDNSIQKISKFNSKTP